MITNHHPAGFLRVACGTLLLGGFALTSVAQEKAPAPQPAAAWTAPSPGEQAQRRQKRMAEVLQWEATVKLELRAVGEVGGVPVALIDVAGEPQIMMKSSGIMGLRIAAIDVAAQTATVANRAGENRILSLTNPREIAWPRLEAKLFLHPEAMASRRESAGRDHLPGEVLLAWPQINREGKEAILLNYLQRGLVMAVNLGPAEGMSVQRSFLFAEQEQRLRREKREKFLASLTPEQRAAYGAGAQPVIRFTDPPEERDKQAARAREAKERMDKVIAGLTPEQKTLYDDISGPAPSRPIDR
jgi:hypothetical protein